MGKDNVFVNTLTGEIRVIDGYDIDIEGNSSNLTILLMVIDSHGLNATTKVNIKITDINDNAPIVENDGEIFIIFSNVTLGWRIGQIQASDLDSGKNSVLVFSLNRSSLNDTSHFLINPRDGWITLTGMITFENQFSISVTVSDSGQSINTATATVHVVVAKSTNDTILQSQLLQCSGSTYESRSHVIFIQTGLILCFITTIAILSYQLWKARKVQRTTQPEQDHDAHHEYRFQWVPRQIAEEGHETDARNSRSSLNAIPSFLRTSVSNQNYQYELAVASSSQDVQEPCIVNQQLTGIEINEGQ